MKVLEAIKVLPFAKFQAILMSFLGLFTGFLYSFGGFFFDVLVSLKWMQSAETPGLSSGTFLAFGALVGMPIIFAFCGFFAGIIEAILYNYFTKIFGGFKINF